MRENLCKLSIWQGLNNQNIQGAQKHNTQRINNPMNKYANELNRQLSKEEEKWPEIHEVMFNIAGHKGNANQNNIQISPYSIGMTIINDITTHVGGNEALKEPLSPVSGNLN
jgi:hypothetical protein